MKLDPSIAEQAMSVTTSLIEHEKSTAALTAAKKAVEAQAMKLSVAVCRAAGREVPCEGEDAVQVVCGNVLITVDSAEDGDRLRNPRLYLTIQDITRVE